MGLFRNGGLGRRTAFAAVAAVFAVVFLPCVRAGQAADAVRVGVMAGDGEDVLAVVAAQAKQRGLDVRVVPFSDYTLPNEALNAGDIDANAFQHVPFPDNQIKTRGYRIAPVGYTIIAPIGIYSRKHHAVAELPEEANVGIPNDPSNGGRGLLLLQAQGLIKLRDGVGLLPTPRDIVDNPHKFRITELDAGIIGRAVPDLDAAVVNTDWALKAGLDLQNDRIAIEAAADNPYRNVIAVRQGNENAPWVKTLVDAYHTDAVRQFILTHFKGAEIPAW
jgi:D-methionine transport system substrate-binding protein